MDVHERRGVDERTVDALHSLRADHGAVDPRTWSRGLRGSVDQLRASLTTHSVRVIAVGIALCIASVVAATLILRSTTAEVHGSSEPSSVTAIPPATPVTTERAAVVVHASGAVREPGVHRLPVGSRVVDLLDGAGGPTEDIDMDRINLAASLVDGQRVWIPRIGEAAPVLAEGKASSSGAGSGPALVDLNHSSADQLDALPGIGPSTAAAIVSHRERNGSFRTVDDLEQVRGIGPSKIEALRDLVVCG